MLTPPPVIGKGKPRRFLAECRVRYQAFRKNCKDKLHPFRARNGQNKAKRATGRLPNTRITPNSSELYATNGYPYGLAGILKYPSTTLWSFGKYILLQWPDVSLHICGGLQQWQKDILSRSPIALSRIFMANLKLWPWVFNIQIQQ
jgi:hypothetical protein